MGGCCMHRDCCWHAGCLMAANVYAGDILLLRWYNADCICLQGQPDVPLRLPEGKQERSQSKGPPRRHAVCF